MPSDVRPSRLPATRIALLAMLAFLLVPATFARADPIGDISFSPGTPFAFADTTVGSSTPTIFTIKNGSALPVTISGFALTGIKVNNQIWVAPTGETFNDTSVRPGIGGEKERARPARVFSRTSLTDGRSKQQQQQAVSLLRTTTTKGKHILNSGASSMRAFAEQGWKPKAGFQLRYVYFLDPTARERLTVPILPFSEIDKRGAGMYRGQPRDRSRENAAPLPSGEGAVMLPGRSTND